jgi:hypothetical protein
VSTIEIPVGPGNEAAIQTLLTNSLNTNDTYYPSHPCNTPIDTAVAEAATDPGLADTSRGEFTALITDGQQVCGDAATGNADTVASITSMLQSGIKTFVIGFDAAANTTALNSFAAAGGEANPTAPNQFYNAADQAGLSAALDTIAKASLSCTLQLSQPLPNGDPSLLYVFFDMQAPPVARDTTRQSGWDYDVASNTVTIYGASCADLKDGAITDVEAVYGCPGAPPPPPPAIQ